MSVQDDASTVRKTSFTNSPAWAALWAALAGVLAAVLVPAAWMPYTARLQIASATAPFSARERAALRQSDIRIDQHRGTGDAWDVVASAPSAEQAEGALAGATARILARGGGSAPAVPADATGLLPDPSLSRAGRTAAWLLAEAGALEHAAEGNDPPAGVVLPAPSSAEIQWRGSLALLDDAHAGSVRTLDVDRLVRLSRVIPAAEMAWAREAARHASEVGSAALDVERALLRVRWLQRAGRDRRTAGTLLERRPAAERALIEDAAGLLEASVRADLPGVGELARDVSLSPWILPARRSQAPRAAAGLIVAGLALVVVRGLGHRRRLGALPRLEGGERPEALGEFAVHWASAPTARAAAQTALALAARALERGERVLLVDAGHRTQLHRVLGRDNRWGLHECVRDRLPILGLVQDGGQPGLFLLTHGEGGAPGAWREVARVLGGARTHFDRTILCLEAAQLREAGRLLMADGFGWWWGRVGGKGRRPTWLTEMMDNSCNDIAVPASFDLSLDLLAKSVRPSRPAPARPVVEIRAPLPPTLVPEPALDCDLQVGERLRFLAWVRQLHEELPSATSNRQPAEEDAVTSR